MPVFKGNTSGSIASIAYSVPSTVISWFLTNKSGGSITANFVVIPNGGTPVSVWSGSIASAATATSDIPLKLLAGYQMLLIVSGSTDYYINIE